MFKIGEFSKLSQVSIRMLRHYDKIDLLVPKKTDKFTGYRYYSASQLIVINRIQELKKMGFSLNEIKDILKDYKDDDSFKNALKARKSEIEIQIAVDGDYKDTQNVKFIDIAPMKVASVMMKGGYEQIGNVNEAIVNWVQDNNYEFDGDMFSIYHVGPAETKNQDELVTEICFPIKKK